MRSRRSISSLLIFLFLAAIAFCQSQSRPEEQLREIVRSNPNDWKANYRLGEFYLHTGKIAEGIPWMEKAVALHPGDYVAAYDLALAYYDTHDNDKARRQIRAMLTNNNSAELDELLADVEESAGNYVAAADEYQAAARIDPSEEHIFAWATELILHKTYAPAITILTRGVALYPRSAKLSVGLGIALYLDGQYEKAMRQLCAATDLAPSESWPYLFLGASYAGMSSRLDTAEVRERLKRFAALEPRNPKALYYYAITIWDRDDHSESDTNQAESLMARAVAADPDFRDAHLQLGILYADCGEYAKAIDQLTSAIRLDPNLAAAHYHLAQAYSRTGQKDLANREFLTFQRIHGQETEAGEKERDRVAQFIVSMKEQGSANQ